eukprot:SAG31_NODE_28854_length_404_cov_1.009836_1_plen_33_part_10
MAPSLGLRYKCIWIYIITAVIYDHASHIRINMR